MKDSCNSIYDAPSSLQVLSFPRLLDGMKMFSVKDSEIVSSSALFFCRSGCVSIIERRFDYYGRIPISRWPVHVAGNPRMGFPGSVRVPFMERLVHLPFVHTFSLFLSSYDQTQPRTSLCGMLGLSGASKPELRSWFEQGTKAMYDVLVIERQNHNNKRTILGLFRI